MPDDVWPLVHAERRALIEDLERLGDADWRRPSLCSGWTIHDVAAHLVDVATSTRLGFAIDMVRARFDFDRQNDNGIERARGATPRATLARMRAAASRTSTPIAPLGTRIVEEVVHGEDIRRPLGLARFYPRKSVVAALRQQARMSAAFGGAKELVGRVRLTATDTEFVIGAGDEIRGPALALLLAVSGRHSALDELDGPGLSSLR